MSKPLCFVPILYGTKPDAAGLMINFDALYRALIAPASTDAGFEPLRADENRTRGIIHNTMFGRMSFCAHAFADCASESLA